MPSVVVVGAQWGDEGKGKITDFLAGQAAAVVRYQGGNNAGHTILVGDEKYKLHLIPSGILYRSKICILGNGVVVDLPALVAELDALGARGVDTSGLAISSRAHLILPYHKVLDGLEEDRKGAGKIGTTRRGIGPAYRDKVNRLGLRVGDLADPVVVAAKLEANRLDKEPQLAGQDLDWAAMTAELLRAFDRVRRHVADTGARIHRLLDERERVLFEGAQGTFLDLDHGTYPFVTSSTPTAGGACVGSGVGPTRIDAVIGVTKAYTTRVGSGPFPTELTGAVGDLLVDRGQEFGTTTGRRRRCGWLDMVMLRYAARVNGLTGLAVTKLDVLDEFETLEVCVGYELDGKRITDDAPDAPQLERIKPIFESMPGWKTSTSGIRRYDDLPAAARTYLERIEEFTGVRVQIVSVGADRVTTIVRQNPWDVLGRS